MCINQCFRSLPKKSNERSRYQKFLPTNIPVNTHRRNALKEKKKKSKSNEVCKKEEQHTSKSVRKTTGLAAKGTDANSLSLVCDESSYDFDKTFSKT